MNMNPFFSNYNTPHGTVPFHLVKLEHFEPAIREGIKQQQAEIDAITAQTEEPTFENTIEAFEQSGRLLERATMVFENLMSAETNDKMQELAKTLPFGAVWADFCERYGVPAGQAYLDELASYEKNVTSKR